MLRVADGNAAAPSSAVVQSVEFHPSAPVLMTVHRPLPFRRRGSRAARLTPPQAGFDKCVRLFTVDGEENPLLQSVMIKDFPIASAQFALGGTELVLSARRKHFYVYNLEQGVVRRVAELQGRSERSLERMFARPDRSEMAFTGHDGAVVLVSSRTKQVMGELKMSGSARSVAFPEDENKLLTAGGDGTVYLWDLRTRRCQHTFANEGGGVVTTMAVGSGGRVACGSDAGVVNLYDGSCLSQSEPTPTRAFMNLTTIITSLAFHPAGEMLSFASREKKGALRVAHCASGSVFKNWCSRPPPPSGGAIPLTARCRPTAQTPLGHPSALTYSPNGGYMAIGNEKGRALLYRVVHYGRM